VKNIRIVKVVSKNFFTDFIESIKNLIGKNLTGYEQMVDKAMNQIDEELKTKYQKQMKDLKTYRYEITQLTNGAVTVLMYGELKC